MKANISKKRQVSKPHQNSNNFFMQITTDLALKNLFCEAKFARVNLLPHLHFKVPRGLKRFTSQAKIARQSLRPDQV